MRLSESQAMALLHAMLGGEIPQDRLAIILGLDRGTVSTALEGDDDHYFNTKTRKRTKEALDACIDPQKKQVSEHIASAYDWFEAKNAEYSEEFLRVIKDAASEPVVDKWADINCGQDLKKELQNNPVDMEKICDAIKECMQIETNKEHKTRRENEKAATESRETAFGVVQEPERGFHNAIETKASHFAKSPNMENDGINKRAEPPRVQSNGRADYWQRTIEPNTAIGQSPSKSKWKPIAIGTVCLVAAVLIAAIAMCGADSTGSIDIYSSEVMSYTVAGFQQEPSSGGITNIEPLSVNEAFSCLSFVRNTSETPTMISSTTFVADEVDEIVEPVVKIEPIVADGKLLVYAVNDGWGTLANNKIELFASATSDSSRLPLSDCFAEEASQASNSLAPGAVILLGSYDLDSERYMEIANPSGTVTGGWELQIYATISGENETLIGHLAFDSDNSFIVEYGGKGGAPRYSTSLFAVLDVDRGPSRISFTSEEAAPRIEDVYRIETVIAPTRSCLVRFHEEFAVGSAAFSTNEHEVVVKVPYYEVGSFANSLTGGSPLARKLSKNIGASTVELEQIATEFQYKPEVLGDKMLANKSTNRTGGDLDIDYILQELTK